MMAETAKFRLGAGDAVAATQPDASIAAAFGNRFAIPLDFEILTDHGPFYQAGLNDRLTFELTFNDYGRDITSTDKSASHTITNISLEFDVVINPDLARQKRIQYMGRANHIRPSFVGKLGVEKHSLCWTSSCTPTTATIGTRLTLRSPQYKGH